MSFSEKLKKSVNYYKKDCNIQELNYVLEEIKQNPKIIINDIKENLTVLMSIVCHKYSSSDYNEIIPLKISIFDFLISLIEFSDIAWYLVEHVGIISILYDEFYCETDIVVKVKLLKCMEIYLLFEKFECKLYGQCNHFCCDLGAKRVIEEVKIFEICQSIIQSIVGLDSSSQSSNTIENHLITLSFIFRRYSMNLSPELCGDIDTFKLFNKFLLSVCESDRYSSICAISALSCFYHASDPFSTKCFTVTNVEFTVNILYNSLTKSELNTPMPTSLYAVLLLNDVLHNQTIAEYIKQHWTLVHYKSICKLLIYEFPSAHYEKVLELFCTIKSIIPEWNGVIEKYLMSNSKFLKFLNDLTCKSLNNGAIMAWQLLQSYFQPAEIPNEFLPEFCTLIMNSVKTNLEAAFYPQQQQCSAAADDRLTNDHIFLTNRGYMRSIIRASSALDMLLLMVTHDDIAAGLANICAKIHLVSFIETLVKDLLDESHNVRLVLSMKPDSSFDMLCESNNWFAAATRFSVSLVFFGINMSTRYPNLICRRNLNVFLLQPVFLKVLVVCLTRSTSSFLIGRSIALIVVSSQFQECDMSKLSEMICDSTLQFHINCQNHLKIKQTSSSSSLMPSCDDVSLKYKLSVRKLVDSWINDQKSLSESDLTTIFVEEIKNLREHQNSLEDFVKKKDDYIRHCQNLTNEYRTKMLNNDSRFHKLMTRHVELQKSSDGQSLRIDNLAQQLTKQEKISENKETEIITLKLELEKFRLNYSELESKYKKEVKKITDAEVLVDDLHKRLANYQEKLEKSNKEVLRLQKINKIIDDLIGNKISPESFSSTGEGC